MEEWKTYKLGEVCSRLRSGKGIPSSFVAPSGEYPVIGGNGVRGYAVQSNFDGECGVIGRQGAYCGNVRYFNGSAYMTEHAIVVVGNEKADTYYLTALLSTMNLGHLSAQSAQPGLSVQTLSKQEITLPSLATQRRVSAILKSLDNKIELNNRINHNLEEQAQALYKSWFVDFEPFKNGKFVESELGMIPEGWSIRKAEEFCEINIGKTPPRKEHQWFSNEGSDVTWISISDMGASGMYISRSSEMLTKEACKKFNIIVVPEGTVLLSFKLTVGRVSIASKDLTSNEAIARFLAPSDAMRFYLYLALKLYDYSKLGSTSSIATAVNSKIIKGMPLTCPPTDVLKRFGEQVKGMFNSMKTLQEEISCLCEQRDSLLPRLMSGELTC